MSITSLERDGNQLLIKGRVFGTMPLVARLRPEQVRSGFSLLNFKLLLFVISLPFRRPSSSRK
jgi:hypothetical protein